MRALAATLISLALAPIAGAQLGSPALQARVRSGVLPSVALASAPRDGEVLQRDAKNQATVVFAGVVRSPGYASLELETLRDGAAWKTRVLPLHYGKTGRAFFTVADTIEAGLIRYDLSLSLVAGSRRVRVARRLDVLCGDGYLLNGQSNAAAGDFHGEELANGSQSVWIRSFGSPGTTPDSASDLSWHLADGESFYAAGSVGAWGLRMAEQLVQEFQVPVALINGAVLDTSIAMHQRNASDPADLGTIYGRLLARASAAGLATSARALFWYQGESDGEEREGYRAGWQALREAWALDYPALERIYVFQVRGGCGVDFAGVREVQRRLPERYPEVAVMSTDAAPGHDGCHFLYAGYRELGERIGRLVARDLLGSPVTQDIDAPDLASARFTGPGQERIVLTFRDPDDMLLWQPGTETHVRLDDGVAVTGAAVHGHTVTLELAGPSAASRISLDGPPFDGPWLVNARGVGALSFFDVAVVPHAEPVGGPPPRGTRP